MKEFLKFIYLLILFSSITGCFGQPISSDKNNDYIKRKSEFELRFTRHFPASIETNSFMLVSKHSISENQINFYLYEFDVGASILDSLNEYIKLKNLFSYNWKDSCLLTVHPNETLEPFEEEPFDTNSLNLDCLKDKLPIPNFINLKYPNSKNGITMDSTFNIFILEAKAEKSSLYKMTPLKSMPKRWENGFSRGIAISNENAVVIYWTIIW